MHVVDVLNLAHESQPDASPHLDIGSYKTNGVCTPELHAAPEGNPRQPLGFPCISTRRELHERVNPVFQAFAGLLEGSRRRRADNRRVRSRYRLPDAIAHALDTMRRSKRRSLFAFRPID